MLPLPKLGPWLLTCALHYILSLSFCLAQAAAEGIISDTHASWRKLVAAPADDSIQYGLDALKVLKPKLWTA